MTTPAGLADFDSATPAIPLDQNILTQTGVAVQLGTPVLFEANIFARSSYIITVDALAPAATTVPWISLDMFWADPDTGATIARERWYINATTSSPASANALVAGRGPTKSSLLNMTLMAYDSVQAMSCDLSLYQSTRAVTRDDWRSLGTGAMGPSFVNAGGDQAALIAGSKIPASLAAGTSVKRVCGLYSGQAQFCLIQDGVQSLAWTVQAVEPGSAAANWPVVAGATTSSPQANYAITLPRSPTYITVTNNGGVATDVQWCLTAQEFAS